MLIDVFVQRRLLNNLRFHQNFQCKPEYKVPGLYVIDSIVRQSRHQFGTEKDVFAPRFARNLKITFGHLFNCPAEDKVKFIIFNYFI